MDLLCMILTLLDYNFLPTSIFHAEIAQVRERLFHKNGTIQKSNTELPDPMGQIITLQRKVYIPVKENPTVRLV